MATAAASPAGRRQRTRCQWVCGGFLQPQRTEETAEGSVRSHLFTNSDDPLLSEWQRLHELGALDLRVMGNVGMEGSAHWVWKQVNELLQQRDGGRSWCRKVKPGRILAMPPTGRP